MDFFEKVDSGYYTQSQLPSTVSREFKEGIEAQIRELDNSLLTERERLEESQKLQDILKKKRKEVFMTHFKDLERLLDLFEQDVEKELGFEHLPDPVKELIHDYAWEQGHRHGLREVLNHYLNLVKLTLAAYGAGKTQNS